MENHGIFARFMSKKIIFLLAFVCCLSPLIDPPMALLLGIVLALTMGNPFEAYNQKAISFLLKLSVIGLGFGMQLHSALEAGKEGFYITLFSIVITMTAGILLAKWLKVEDKTGYLIASGTAICGGSAIAAVSPIIQANEKQISVALGTVFLLNAVALITFPVVGNWVQMTQHQFGLWCAVAIHDTSSVVGAAVKYGEEALQTATTVKLERALWIIPLSVFTLLISKGKRKMIALPYFIVFFIIAMVIRAYVPAYISTYEWIAYAAKRGLTATLFLIGSGLSLANIKAVGIKPLQHAVLLWIMVSIVSAIAIVILA